jgi:hypothetical protein
MDRPARARTRAGRLASLDQWVVWRERGLLQRRDDAPFVDVGFGCDPVTTLEAARALRQLNPSLPVIGVELDAARAERAQERAHGAAITIRQGGFHEIASIRPKPRLIRAMNVLRSYPPHEVAAAQELLAQALADGGLLLEGTSDARGSVLTAWMIRRRGGDTIKEGLLFYTDFTRGFSPWMLRDFLPRDLRRSVVAGTPAHRLLSQWHAHFSVLREVPRRPPDELFERSVCALALESPLVEPGPGKGYAYWRLEPSS